MHKPLISLILPVLLVTIFACSKSTPENNEKRTVLAVFAHPDDEFMVSPILSKFARQGYDVHMAVATDGRFGVAEHAGIPAGDSLAEVRTGEIQCSAKVLGANPPVLLALQDGFAHKQADLGNTLEDFRKLHQNVLDLIKELEPDAVITWSPGGGYGHPDHRAISNIVTEIFQSGDFGWPTTLLYTGISSERLETLPEFSRPVINWFAGLWNTTSEQFLDVQISYDDKDLVKARDAISCHKSQFTEADMDELIEMLDYVYNGKVTLRSWDGESNKAINLVQ